MTMSESQTDQLTTILATSSVIFGIIGLAMVVFSILIYWKIFSKAGYSGAMSLLMLVPIANIVVICILAFGEWPIYRELNQLRMQAMNRGQQYPQPPQYPQYPQGPRY
jgi:uncharacterized membrane protein YhaH (DUF805 family)